MGIFGRKRRSADPDPSLDAEEPLEDDATDDELRPAHAEPADQADSVGESGVEGSGVDEMDSTQFEPAFSRARGPFDRSEVEHDDARLDLGALWVPAVEGMQLRLEVDEASQTVSAVQVALDGSFAQLQAFAAPKSSGLWPDIRTEIAHSVNSQGGSARVVDGPLGRELAVQMPGGGPAVRFLGVDGPRWFLRAVLSGPAASDDAAATRLVEAVRGTVVVRGAEAMAPRELLPLRPPAMTAAPDADTAADVDEPQQPRSTDDLRPFERGPEITEVR